MTRFNRTHVCPLIISHPENSRTDNSITTRQKKNTSRHSLFLCSLSSNLIYESRTWKKNIENKYYKNSKRKKNYLAFSQDVIIDRRPLSFFLFLQQIPKSFAKFRKQLLLFSSFAREIESFAAFSCGICWIAYVEEHPELKKNGKEFFRTKIDL